MVPWLRRRRLSVSSLAFAGWTRRFRRARDPRTTVARSVSGRVRRQDVAGEYGARTAEEWLPLTLIGSGRTPPNCCSDCYSDWRYNQHAGQECDLPPVENGNPRKLEAATHPPRYGGIPSCERAPNVHNGELTNAHRSG